MEPCTSGLIVHIGLDKTIILVKDGYFPPYLRQYVEKFFKHCYIFQITNVRFITN